ncbi:MAG: A/G-specific adenine glycosylase [Cephaloticoccus sp.]|nr:A/G-specific adenine glycosylase [Cephaloticoccus sp.]MCF7759956.1 A/G-specific adenine glycosylase [Cephaloticoccus sp.]
MGPKFGQLSCVKFDRVGADFLGCLFVVGGLFRHSGEIADERTEKSKKETLATFTWFGGQCPVPRPSKPTSPIAAGDFQVALLQWYKKHFRPLPWRDKPSLYKTVVSEFMLQQTQVKTVLPYFARWVVTLPDFAALAAATEARVLRLWEGLGYYSRARNLHKLAKTLVALPQIPETPGAWQELPGIGPYSAAAITSISFGAQAAVVDGNVVRILARLTADSTVYRDSSTAAKAYVNLADALLNRKNPGDHNQAMMELGATVCLRRNPLCTICPVAGFCRAYQSNDPESYPRLAPKKMEQVTVMRAWCVRSGRLLLHRTSSTARRLANLHELPTPVQLGLDPAMVGQGELLAKKRRSITRYQIIELIHRTKAPARLVEADLVWVPVDELESISLSGPHRRWVDEIIQLELK